MTRGNTHPLAGPKTHPLVAALLSFEERPSRSPEMDAHADERKLPEITLYAGAATACDARRLRIAAPAAAVAILEHPAKKRTLVEQLDEANIREAAIAAVALGLEELKRPCRVRIVTRCVELIWIATGYVRSHAYYEQMSRLNRAARKGGHLIEWVEPVDGYDQTMCAITYDTAYRTANLHAPVDGVLKRIAEETTTLADGADETGLAPLSQRNRLYSVYLLMKRAYGYARRLKNQFAASRRDHRQNNEDENHEETLPTNVAPTTAHSSHQHPGPVRG